VHFAQRTQKKMRTQKAKSTIEGPSVPSFVAPVFHCPGDAVTCIWPNLPSDPFPTFIHLSTISNSQNKIKIIHQSIHPSTSLIYTTYTTYPITGVPSTIPSTFLIHNTVKSFVSSCFMATTRLLGRNPVIGGGMSNTQ